MVKIRSRNKRISKSENFRITKSRFLESNKFQELYRLNRFRIENFRNFKKIYHRFKIQKANNKYNRFQENKSSKKQNPKNFNISEFRNLRIADT